MSEDKELRAFARHARAAGFCARGGLKVLKRYGIKPATAAAEGVPLSVLEATDDALALRVVQIVREEAARG